MFLKQFIQKLYLIIMVQTLLILPQSIPVSYTHLDVYKRQLLQDMLIISVITLVSTIIVMVVTGKIAQLIIERKEQNKNG